MDRSPVVVAVVCSAGGPDAVSELLSALPTGCAAAFIVVSHLDSIREELLLETLSQSTTLPVLRAQDDLVAQQGHVYLVSANTTLTMTGGRIRVAPNAAGQHHAGNILFTSLAQERGGDAIGVVLSGQGSDGACGIQAIRQSGGATLAQHPGSARFPSMPINAIETGCVDFVLRPDEIARELSRVCGYRSDAALAASGDECELPPSLQGAAQPFSHRIVKASFRSDARKGLARQ